MLATGQPICNQCVAKRILLREVKPRIVACGSSRAGIASRTPACQEIVSANIAKRMTIFGIVLTQSSSTRTMVNAMYQNAAQQPHFNLHITARGMRDNGSSIVGGMNVG